jgi:uncharacterized protein YuzE
MRDERRVTRAHDAFILTISDSDVASRVVCELSAGETLLVELDRIDRIVRMHIPDADGFLRGRSDGHPHGATYSPSIDMAYVELIPIRAGGVEVTDTCELPMSTMVNVDFDETGHIVGLEFDGAMAALPGDFLDRTTIVE